MLRRLAFSARTHQRTFASNSPSLHETATKAWDTIMADDWVDNENYFKMVDDAQVVIDAYRPQYAAEHAAGAVAKETYEKMKDLYQAKEAALIVDCFAAHIEDIARDHEDYTGALGNDIELPQGAADVALQTLQEYINFVNGLENEAIGRKVEEELGRKIIGLRMTLSIENFSAEYAPTACDHLVTRTDKK